MRKNIEVVLEDVNRFIRLESPFHNRIDIIEEVSELLISDAIFRLAYTFSNLQALTNFTLEEGLGACLSIWLGAL